METRTLLLFDFGGTLNTNGDHWGALFRRRLSPIFPRATVGEIEQAYIQVERSLVSQGLGPETFAETLRQQVVGQFEILGGDQETAEKLARDFYKGVRKRMRSVRLLFTRLVVHHQVGVVSNFYGNLPVVIEEFGLAALVDPVVDSSIVGIRKPNAEIWRHAIELASNAASRTIVVGDSHKNDVAPAAALGCRMIWYRGLEWRPVDSALTASAEVTSLEELEEAIDGMTSPR